jgi:drug/metabolite transporter (DMT)-like permease
VEAREKTILLRMPFPVSGVAEARPQLIQYIRETMSPRVLLDAKSFLCIVNPIVTQPWISLSLISAFSLTTRDALTKRIITPANEYVIAWLRIVYALPALSAAALVTAAPALDRTFFAAFCTALPLELLAVLLYYKALRVLPLSLSLPFLSFTPVFLILFSRVMIGQAVSAAGGAGIALIALGGYTLNLSSLRTGLFGPLKAMLRERGSLYMLAVALICSATSALGKCNLLNS